LMVITGLTLSKEERRFEIVLSVAGGPKEVQCTELPASGSLQAMDGWNLPL
jgi:hypothetical protein